MIDTKELLYYNGFGGFSKDGKEYVIKTNEENTPAPWSHMMANPNFGTIVTAGGGGYTWSHNSRENKITTWSNDPVGDKASEKIYIVENEENREIYPLPYESLKDFEICFGFGYASFQRHSDKLNTDVLMFVPMEENKKIVRIAIENLTEEEKQYKVCYLADVVLGVSKEFTAKHLVFENMENGVRIKNCYRDFYQDEYVYLLTKAEMEGENANRNDVSESIQYHVDREKNVILENNIKVPAHQKVYVIFTLEAAKAQSVEMQETNQSVMEKREKVKSYWEKMLGWIKVKTPVESMNIMMNGWLGYQTIVSRLWGRTSFYQAGGAFRF
ncbi:MAG: hypothetical protein IJ215_01860 [Clostridia bacterium]|nr:hypothetical protein [Clostridia bacterium]